MFNLLTLESVDRIYECAANCTIQRHRVRYDELGQFSTMLHRFKLHLGEQIDDPYWQKFVNYLGRFRFDLCATPILNNLRDDAILEVHATLSAHLKNCAFLYPGLTESSLQLLTCLKSLYKNTNNPLLDKLIELNSGRKRVAWVIKESRLLSQADKALRAYPEILRHVEVRHVSQMYTDDCFDMVTVIGSPGWFPDSIFTSPRADSINIVQYSWIRDSWNVPGTFVVPYKPQHTKRKVFIEDHAIESLEVASAQSLLLVPDSQAITAYTKQNEHHEYEEVDARCVVFEDGQALFVDASESAKILVIDVDEVEIDTEENRVKSVTIRDLVPGLFIIVRTNGGGDYIVPIADQIMGDTVARTARQRQANWKMLLKKHVVAHGTFKTCLDLLDLGSEIAEEVNVRNWMLPRSIKTRSKSDFAAIMKLIGLEKQADDYWNTMELISRAHQRAGFQLRDILLDQIREISIDEFRRSGRVEFRVSDSDEEAGITAFRIEGVLPQTYKVAYSQIGIPFKPGT